MSEHEFGLRLVQLRGQRGLSRPELARRAGLTPEGVSLIERGKRTDPALSTVRALARALGVAPVALLPALAEVERVEDPADRAPELAQVP
jgi:transcriptional regulator with XRE-family HTH domain